MVNPGYRKRTIFLLVALLVVRFWFGQTFELSGQEAYLWLQGHGSNLSPAYWERGPMVPLTFKSMVHGASPIRKGPYVTLNRRGPGPMSLMG